MSHWSEQGLNAALFWEKVDFREYIPMVPTSAITGDGMGDLIALLVTFSLKMLTQQLMLSMELEALVLEVGCDESAVLTCSVPLIFAGQGYRWFGDNH